MKGTSRCLARWRTASASVPSSILTCFETLISRPPEVGERIGVLADRGDPLGVPLGAGDLHLHRVAEIAAVEALDRRPGVVVGPESMLHPRVRVDLMGGGGVEPSAAGEDEPAPVGDPEVDRPGAEVVGAAQQVLGGVDDVVGDPQRAGDHVGRAAGEDRYRDVGSGESVDDLVEGPVAAEGDDDVIAAVNGLAADLGGVILRLRRHGLDLVAALERVDDEVLEPIRHGRRVRVDDDQHPAFRTPLIPRRIGARHRLPAQERIEASTWSRFASMSARETSDSRLRRRSGSVLEGRTLKCQSG